MKLIIANKNDIAGVNIAKKILENHKFNKSKKHADDEVTYETEINKERIILMFTNVDLLYEENIFKKLDPELIICVSKHSSEKGTKVLTVHPSGNIAEAKFGGFPRNVSISAPAEMKQILIFLLEEAEKMNLKEYKVSYEATHHGPTVDYPLMFVEVGSKPEEWRDENAAEAAAKAVLNMLKQHPTHHINILGVGGGHYCPKFTKIGLETEFAPGHIISKHNTKHVDKYIFNLLIEKTLGKVNQVLFDWKGIKGKDRRRIINYCEELNMEYDRI